MDKINKPSLTHRTNRLKKYNALLFVGVLPALVSLPVSSQSASSGFVLEEVVVTARKREENVSDVPLSVSAYSARDLGYRQIQTTDQLTQVTPNLQFGTHAPSSGHNSAATIFIRGVGQPDFIPASDPGVGIYIDGVYIARSVGLATELLDLERIEILRGPQGTLFGRNTIGGAVVLHTKRPSEQYSADMGLRIGSDNRIEVEGKVNIPVSQALRIKLSAASRQRDGYVDNVLTGEDLGDDNSLGFRFAADADITEQVNAFWTIDYVTEDENGSPTVFNSLNTSALFARLAAGTAGPPPAVPNFGDRGVPDANGVNQLCAFENAAGANVDNTGFVSDLVLNCGGAGTFDLGNAGPYKNYANGDLESTLDVWGTALSLDVDLEFLSIKSITAYRSTQYSSKRDADTTPLTILHSENHDDIWQFSQELQLTGTAMDDRFTWVGGLYYFKEEADIDNPVFLPALTVGALNNAGELETENTAVFAQGTYDILDNLHLTLGIRHTSEDKLATPNFYAIGNYNVPNPFSQVGLRCGGPGLVVTNNPFDAINRPDAHCIGLADGERLYANQQNKLSFSQTTPMLSLSFDLSDQTMLYGTYSEGFKSGGYSTRIIQPVPSVRNPDGVTLLPTFEPEEAQTLEVGFKGQFENFTVSAAIFNTDYKNQHVIVRQGVAPITFNAGESTIKGFEFESTWTPASNWYITSAVGYTDGEYESFTGLLKDKYDAAVQASQIADPALRGPAPEDVLGLVDLNDELAYTPKVTGSVGISYMLSTQMGVFTPRLDWSYRGKIYFDAPNSEAIAQESYHTANAALAWKSSDESWEAVLAVSNLTDELYLSGGNISFSGSAYAESIYARSREWSLFVKKSF